MSIQLQTVHAPSHKAVIEPSIPGQLLATLVITICFDMIP